VTAPQTITAPTAPAAVRFATGRTSIYPVAVALFCVLLVTSNIAASKPIGIGGLIVDGGALVFPLTYILGDILAEVYGWRRTRLAILCGFVAAALASVILLVAAAAPPAPGYADNEAFRTVLGFVPRVVAASAAGYLAGQFLNAVVLVRIKQRTGEDRLWARLLGSSVVGQLADTVIFCTIAFAGVLSGRDLLVYIAVGYLYKCLVEVALLPATMAVIKQIKRREPGYRTAEPGVSAVQQLRVVVAVEDYDEAVSFYRDRLGLVERESHVDGDARVTVLDAGRATLELANLEQQTMTDNVEVGHQIAPKIRLTFQVDDTDWATDGLRRSGASVIAPPTATPWRTRASRLNTPGDLQVTVFTVDEGD
jgi:queuosine precursor transporter